MAWFKCSGGGIPAILKTRMNNVFNKKFGTSTTYQPDGWPDEVNLLGALEEKTVSGSVVTFSDGADAVKLKSCAVTIAPTLDGVSSVDVVQTGRNLLEIDSSYDISTRATTLTRDYSNNVLHIYGEVQDTNSNYYSQDITDLVREMGTITIIANTVSGGTADLSFCVNVQNGSTVISRLSIGDTSRTITYTEGYTYLLMFFVSISATVGNTVDMTVNFEADYGSSVGAYTPYVTPTTHTANLGRIIHGGEVDVVNGTGTDEWGRVVYTGEASENWAVTQASGIYRFYIRNDDVKAPESGRGVVYSSIGAYASTGYAVGTCYSSYSNSKVFIYYVPPQTVTTVEDFKTWLSSNNFDVVFEKATADDFTFTPVPIISRLGDNTMWGDGDLSVIYRSSGTQTIIQPTLISKTITENGTYSAEDDNADGYDEVTVNVQGGAQNIETVLSSNPLIEVSGMSGTDVERTMWTYTASSSGKIVFHANTQVKTNTGANDGYFKVLKNSEVIVSTYANTSTTTALVIPDIELEAGDVLTIVGGFDNSHTSCWFDLYSMITILSSGSAPVLGLGLGNPGPVNESEQEEEPDAAPEDPEEIQEETPEEVDQNEVD